MQLLNYLWFSFVLLSSPVYPTLEETTVDAGIPEMSDNSSTPIPRFPPGEQNDAQKAAFAEAEKRVRETFGSNFKLKDDQGNLLGPFAILSYTSESFLPYLNFAAAVNTLPYITARERELTALATGFVTQTPYIVYAHKNIGMTMGLSQEQVDDAAEGKSPEALEEREKLVYDLALEMAKTSGKVTDEQFQLGVQGIGREGVSSIAQLVGAYLLGSVLVNGADVTVPQT